MTFMQLKIFVTVAELGNVTSVYWFLPNTDKWHVRDSVGLKKI